MTKLRPTLWRSARAIACETRLRFLQEIFNEEEAAVFELAGRVGTSEQNASNQLRRLSSRGLITPYRRNMRVFYRAEANSEVEHAEKLLETLRTCFEKQISSRELIQQATAFTHSRRIEILQALANSPQNFGRLQELTGISSSALQRHLSKLTSRGCLRYRNGRYLLKNPGGYLAKCLFDITCS